jgi:hypothetical protein
VKHGDPEDVVDMTFVDGKLSGVLVLAGAGA